MKQTFPSLIFAVLVLAACQSPVGIGHSAASLSVQFGSPSRGVVADITAQVTSYSIELSSNSGHPTQNKAVTASGSVMFDDVPDGNWDITVTALNGSLPVAVGSVLGHVISSTTGRAVTIALSATQSGTGAFSFSFEFPAAAADFVEAELFTLDGVSQGAASSVELTTNAGVSSGTVQKSTVDSGTYRLALRFHRGGSDGTMAGAFSEAVTIWDNVNSNQWLDSSGQLHGKRTFAASDFNSNNARLSNLILQSGSLDRTPSPGFSSVVEDYSLGVGSSFRFKPVQSMAGQKIEYRQDSGSWTSLVSETFSSVLTIDGLSTVQIRVTATDRVTTATYEVSAFSGVVLYLDGSATGGSAPQESSGHAAGESFTVLGNTGSLTKAEQIFAAWNTEADGTGTTYFPGASFTRGTDDLVLYPIWLNAKLTFSGYGHELIVTGKTQSILGPLLISEGVTSVQGGAFANDATVSAILLPSTLQTIGSSAFMGCSGATTVNIPSGVTTIGSGAFFWCTSLTSISIPAATTSIGTQVFQGCSLLESIDVAADNPTYQSVGGVVYNKAGTQLQFVPTSLKGAYTIPSTVTAIQDSAFNGCTKLTSVTIPEGVTSIGSSAFYSCAALVSVNIPSSVESIGDSAFEACRALTSLSIPAGVTSLGTQLATQDDQLTSLTVSTDNPNYSSQDNALYDKAKTKLLMVAGGGSGVFTVPSSVTTIGRFAFFGAPSITGVSIPSSVDTIEIGAFYSCTGLTSIVVPDTVTALASHQFNNCAALTSVTLPSGLTELGDWMFAGCRALTSITLPAGLTSIGAYVFYGANLTSVTIPSTVTSIGKWAFTGCSNLETVTLNPTTPPDLPSASVAFDSVSPDLEIRVPAASLAAYQSATGWSDYTDYLVSP